MSAPKPSPPPASSAPDAAARFAPHIAVVHLAAVAALGLLHVLAGERLTRMMPGWPNALPGRPWWAHAAGALIAGLAALVLLRRRAPRAALVLGGVMMVPVLALWLPRALPTGTFGNAWLNVLKWQAMAAGPIVAAAVLAPADGAVRQLRIIARVRAVAPWLLAAFMLGSAILHVRHAGFVAQLMQPWMPWRTFWTYFAAAALAAGAIGLVVPRTTRSAALLTSLMILLWFFLVHTPRMLLDPTGPAGWSEMAESLAFAALAFLLAVPPHRGARGLDAVRPTASS